MVHLEGGARQPAVPVSTKDHASPSHEELCQWLPGESCLTGHGGASHSSSSCHFKVKRGSLLAGGKDP